MCARACVIPGCVCVCVGVLHVLVSHGVNGEGALCAYIYVCDQELVCSTADHSMSQACVLLCVHVFSVPREACPCQQYYLCESEVNTLKLPSALI